MKVKRLANAAGVALPLDADYAESLEGGVAAAADSAGQAGSGVAEDDDEGLDLDEFIQQMMMDGGGDGQALVADELPMPDQQQQQQQPQYFTGPVMQPAAAGLGAAQANGFVDNGFRYHGNYGVQQPSLVQPQFNLQSAATANSSSVIFPLSGPQSLGSEFQQQQQQTAQVSQQQQQQPPSGIRAAINLRKRPLQSQQQQLLLDLPESSNDAFDTKPIIQKQQQKQQNQESNSKSSVGGDSNSTAITAGDAGGGDLTIEDPSERKRLKNAQLARENREKKKQHVQELENRVRDLESALSASRERESSLTSELSSSKRHNNYLLSVLYRQSELASFLSTVPALVSRERQLQLQQPQATRDTDSQTTTGGICLHLDNQETVSVLLCDKCAALGGGGSVGDAVLGGSASQPSSLTGNQSNLSL
ncbi:hypothetical protein BOX15_Mlig000991g2 [Macrostomum lignano]|uniref:BZIP domain-containing protein n=1 Tax=Macrostomum lignano TaxID=282301 RepID=A0A267FV91_9PLAT|nr:hypothetical protein BOX15_Mlig000991g2 [Macrostomum lignano]